MDGLAHSMPVVGLVSSEQVDCIFLYALTLDRQQADAPLAVLKLRAIDGSLLCYSEDQPCQTVPALNTMPSEGVPELRRRYEELYPIVRQIAFSARLTAEQHNNLHAYLETLDALTNKEFQAIYKAMAPEFFAWAEAACSSANQQFENPAS